MRRRVVPALIALLAVGLALWQRSRRRAARLLDVAEQRATPVSAAPKALPAAARLLEAGRIDPPRRSMPTTRFLSIPWSPHPDPPLPHTTELQIHCTLTSEGMELARVDVRETASHVFVTVLARWEPSGPDPDGTHASDRGRKREATATLRAPLGDRALVHAPHDEPPR
jgi:hypothetical protein